jgi:aldehyde dehydrogenase (NAD+)
VIDDAAADRIEAWVTEAVEAGAEVLVGGTRDGLQIAPTLLCGAPSDSRVVQEEIFGPVLVLSTFSTIDEAFALVNASRYGLQAGIFTPT